MVSLKALAQQIPTEEVRELAREMLGRGMAHGDVVDELVAFLDGLVDWSSVVKGAAGKALEAGDGPLLRMIVKVVVKSVSRV